MSTPEQDPFRVEDEPDESAEPPPPPPKEPEPPPVPEPDEPDEDAFHVVPMTDFVPPPAPEPETEPEPEPEPAPDEAEGDGFRVVPLDKPPPAAPPASPPRPAPAATPRSPRAQDEETGVDTRTVAERRGDAVALVVGKREPPPGWPAEAFAFPLRRPGPSMLIGAAVFLTLLDLMSRWNFFVGLLAKLIAAVLFLRWQLYVASKTAAGHDKPAHWAGAMNMSGAQIRGVGILLLAALVLAGPGIVADVLERPTLAVVLFLAGGLLLAAGALSQVVGDPTLMRPWNALAWIARRPLGLLVATAGWWAAGWTEIFVWWMRDLSVGWYLVATFGLRLVGMYLWLLSARALGVVGRSWSLFDTEADEATSRAG